MSIEFDWEVVKIGPFAVNLWDESSGRFIRLVRHSYEDVCLTLKAYPDSFFVVAQRSCNGGWHSIDVPISDIESV